MIEKKAMKAAVLEAAKEGKDFFEILEAPSAARESLI